MTAALRKVLDRRISIVERIRPAPYLSLRKEPANEVSVPEVCTEPVTEENPLRNSKPSELWPSLNLRENKVFPKCHGFGGFVFGHHPKEEN